ncbi:MAG: hypothetical protein ACO394_01170 [Blastocatellia bacterium]
MAQGPRRFQLGQFNGPAEKVTLERGELQPLVELPPFALTAKRAW